MILMKTKIVLMTIWLICLVACGFASQGKPTYVSIKGNSEASKEFFQALYLYPAYPLLKQMSIPELIEGRWVEDRHLAFEFELSEPTLINIGEQTNVFYVKPSDSVMIDYKLIGFNERGNLLEEWHIIGRQGLRLPAFPELHAELREIASRSRDEGKITGIQQVNYLDDLSRKVMAEVIKNNPKYGFDEQDMVRIHEHYFQINALQSIAGFSRSYGNYPSSLVSGSVERFLKMVEHISDQHISRNAQYYMVLEHLYRIHYQKKWEPSGYDPDIIQADLVGFDAKTQGYLRFCVLKSDFYTANERPGTVSALIQGISDPSLLVMAEALVGNNANGHNNSPYLDADVGKVLVKDVKGKEHTFASLFEKTNKPFVYFDFCGSWCAPCLQEMEKYAKSGRKHDSDHPDLEVIYLFFEKDDQDWKKVIDEYRLDPQNCYIITNNELQSYFGRVYHWAASFPHHPIFSKNGKMVHRNAPSLLELKMQDYNMPSENTASFGIKSF